jgi:UDP-glucose 6-dehydrogenase
MHITVIGTGYVGLVTATCFAQMDNFVNCVDVDTKKIENLNKGILPIYEPGLDDLLENSVKQGFLKFTTSFRCNEKIRYLFYSCWNTSRRRRFSRPSVCSCSCRTNRRKF